VRILGFTTVFPSAAQPLHGLFVAERTRHAAHLAEISVIAPVAWFRRLRGVTTPQFPFAVDYPRFFYIPGLFKFLDGVLLFLSALPRVRRLRQHFDFDLIDAHFGFPDGVAAILLGRWFHRPVMVTLRGSELEMVQFILRRGTLGWALKRADRVIAVSRQLAELAFELGVDPERVRVIGNGVDLVRFHPVDRAQARRTLGISDAVPLIVAVGHLARVKGFELVLRTIPELATTHPGIRFVIVGGPAATSGDYPTQLAAEVDRLNLSDHVMITGSVPPERVALWLSAADLFVLASEREGSPNALREALACGCPVVAADVGDARELLSDSTGVIVADRTSAEQWRDALQAALGTRWDRRAIRAGAERHTWPEVAARVAAEWRECVGLDAQDIVARHSVPSP
jgi:teichuronic acid biosynthesis glycosyltransferase TuaC